MTFWARPKFDLIRLLAQAACRRVLEFCGIDFPILPLYWSISLTLQLINHIDLNGAAELHDPNAAPGLDAVRPGRG